MLVLNVTLCNRSVQILSYLPIKHTDDKYTVDMSSNIPTVFLNEQYIGLYMDLALHLLPLTLKLRSLQSCKYQQHLSPSMCLIVELPRILWLLIIIECVTRSIYSQQISYITLKIYLPLRPIYNWPIHVCAKKRGNGDTAIFALSTSVWYIGSNRALNNVDKDEHFLAFPCR